MKVILLRQIPNVGGIGDVKDVANGFFRNFLLPRGLAKPATPAGLKEAEYMRKAATMRLTRSKDDFRKLLEAVKNEQLVIVRKANEEGHLFGSVTEKDIATSLSQKGYHVEERNIQLDSPLKALGMYPVVLQFDKDLQGSVSLAIERGE